MALQEFWIDVGGTFTDCVFTEAGEPRAVKVLSSGVTKGRAQQWLDAHTLLDPTRRDQPNGFWNDYRITLSVDGVSLETRVTGSDAEGRLKLADAIGPLSADTTYELSADEGSPILAIRTALGIPRGQPLPPVSVRLGTTRGTNALLTRRGARTALITNRGFEDALSIGYQDRPRLFDLAICKATPLYESVIGIDGRLDAAGGELEALNTDALSRQLATLRNAGIESLAVCLLHAFRDGCHESTVEAVAREVGFREISVSHRVAPMVKLIGRGETTVLDAYLNPILRDYLATLQESLTGSQLRLMTSAGGLVGAERFRGPDSILSGPAGGVVGYAEVARRAGFKRCIGFDMGGTSTDVSRYDGRLETEFEAMKAGVRIVAPMLAIETVAAGGGSVCEFDGVQFHVGPASTGADPGPACYGQDGPLTITDMNLILGRLPVERFPFPLDEQIVMQKLQAQCDQLNVTRAGDQYTPHALAEGYVQIANANMVRTIENISVAKGYDVRNDVLVSFGGAGGQHACSMARLLGMKQILIDPLAGVLSAVGIGQADVRRFAQTTLLRPLDDARAEISALFESLSGDARRQVIDEGVPARQIREPIRSLELRYQGAESKLSIREPADGDFCAAFHAEHERRFGFLRDDRSLEVVACRVEVIGATEQQAPYHQPTTVRDPAPTRVQDVWFGGRPIETGVFLRDQLELGDQIAGPAVIAEPTSTVVIEPGFVAEVRGGGQILLTEHMPMAAPAVTTAADPIQLELFNNMFASIAEQMGRTLQNTAFSTNVKERLDFSCAIFSAAGELVVNAPHIPVHLGAMSETVRCVLADNPDLRRGDVFVTNDPYRGGSHLPDVTVVTPVHGDDGQLRFFTASRAHHAEIGGIVPGSLPPDSRCLEDEGVLIRNFVLVRDGVSDDEGLLGLLRGAKHPSRNPEENLADVAAQVAANRRGGEQLTQAIAANGWPVVEAYMQHIQDAAAEKMRRALARVPDGRHEHQDYLDDGAMIRVAVTVAGDQAEVDFTGSGDVLPNNLNANPGIVRAATLYVLRCLIDEDIPLNDGVMLPVRLRVPPGLLNPPAGADAAHCPAVAGGNVETSQRVVNVLLGALRLAAASQGTMNNLTFGDNSFGYYETIGGGSGRTPHADGADAVHTHMTNTRLTDPEILEQYYPVRLLEFAVRAGSGGAGRYRGGCGLIRHLEFLAPLDVSLLTERRGPHPPFGMLGGAPGSLGRNAIQRGRQSDWETLPAKIQLRVGPGDQLRIETPGGGGWGVLQ